MQRSVDHLQRELQGMQAGRATPTMLDSVSVPVDSAHAPLSSLAKVLVQGPNLLQLSVYDNAHVTAIVRAIETSDLGLQPEQAGKTVRVPVPRATQETREILAKEVKKAAEACRSAVRTHRQPAMKQAKAHALKDVQRRQEKEVQAVTDGFIEKVDALAAAKQKELLSV